MSTRLSQSGIADNKTYFRAHHVAKLNRKELEDHYFKIYEDSIQLKINSNRQNKELKLLRVKLQRFTQYQKRNGKPLPELIEEQSFRIYALERINKNLNRKIEILEQNLLIHSIDKHTLANKYEDEMLLDIDDINKIKPKNTLGLETEDKHVQNTSEIQQNSYKEIENRIGNLEKEIKKAHFKSESNMRDQEVQSDITNFALENKCTKAIICNNCSLSDREKKIEEIFDTSDILSKQLAEEQMKVLELQRQLKGEKISQEVIMEIQNRIDELKKRFQESDSKKSELYKMKIKCKELEIELFESKKTIQILGESNNGLKSQMLNMQINIDMLKQKIVNKSDKMIDASVDSSDLAIITNAKIVNEKIITPEVEKDNVKFELQSNSSAPLQECDGSNFDRHIIENETKNMIVVNRNKTKSSQNVKIIIKESEQDDILIVETDENVSDINRSDCPQLIENSQKSVATLNDTEILHDDSTSVSSYKKLTIHGKLKSTETTSNQDSSDEYLSDGEVKENIHNMHFEYNSEASHDSSLESKNIEKNNNGLTHEQITEKTKSTIKLISKEMEKCKSLLNLTEE